MDWALWTAQWGPAIPMFLAVVWLFKRHVEVTIPESFRELKEAIEKHNADAADRHKENMKEQRRLNEALFRHFFETKKQ